METMIYGCNWCNKELRQNSFPASWKRVRIYDGDDESDDVICRRLLACDKCAYRIVNELPSTEEQEQHDAKAAVIAAAPEMAWPLWP